MFKSKFVPRIVSVMAAAMLALSLSSCDGTDLPDAAADPATDLVVVTLNGSNMPACSIDDLSDLAQSAIKDHGSAAVIIADGEPSLEQSATFGESQANNDHFRTRELTCRMQAIADLLTCSATEQETDVIRSFILAGRHFSSSCGENNNHVLAVFHSGLTTVAPLEFQNLDLSSLEVEGIIQQLDEMGFIPDLSSAEVHWYALCDVDGDQKELFPLQKNKVQDFWEAYFTAAGCREVTFHTDIPLGGELSDAPSVSVVQPESLRSVIPDDEPISLSIGFVKDSCEFADMESALETLKVLSEAINASPEGTYLLAGSTADVDTVTLEKSQRFGLQRAEAVRDTLVSFGVPTERLVCCGVGEAATSLRDSIDQQANRTVWLVNMDSPVAAELYDVGITA